MTKTSRREFGDWGEEQACQFLLRYGYEVIERNYQTRNGEIDIVAIGSDDRQKEFLSFVEVKTRSYGKESAELATGFEKIKRMKDAAKHFCWKRGINTEDTFIRFEQISIYADRKTGKVTLRKYVLPVC
jgi:putative endonuclease